MHHPRPEPTVAPGVVDVEFRELALQRRDGLGTRRGAFGMVSRKVAIVPSGDPLPRKPMSTRAWTEKWALGCSSAVIQSGPCSHSNWSKPSTLKLSGGSAVDPRLSSKTGLSALFNPLLLDEHLNEFGAGRGEDVEPCSEYRDQDLHY
jgi:hypothetical protein